MDMSGLFASKHAVTHIDSLQLNMQSMSGLLQTLTIIISRTSIILYIINNITKY